MNAPPRLHGVDSRQRWLTPGSGPGTLAVGRRGQRSLVGHRRDGTGLGGRAAELAGRSVLVATRDQLAAALALIELDGVARRLILCTPDVTPEHLPAVVAKARRGYDRVRMSERGDHGLRRSAARLATATSGPPRRRPVPALPNRVGAPHVGHDRRARRWSATPSPRLTGADRAAREHSASDVVWGTFYDIRRYGGLQILLRAARRAAARFVLSGARRADRRLPRASRRARRHARVRAPRRTGAVR